MGFPDSAVGLLAAVSVLVQLSVLVFAILVSWRAMRALEDISDTLRERLPGRRD